VRLLLLVLVRRLDFADDFTEFRPGEVLNDRYVVTAVLGKGVFGSVLRAQDQKANDADVAIKVIRNNEIMCVPPQLYFPPFFFFSYSFHFMLFLRTTCACGVNDYMCL
jgi:hypothetical protein